MTLNDISELVQLAQTWLINNIVKCQQDEQVRAMSSGLLPISQMVIRIFWAAVI